MSDHPTDGTPEESADVEAEAADPAPTEAAPAEQPGSEPGEQPGSEPAPTEPPAAPVAETPATPVTETRASRRARREAQRGGRAPLSPLAQSLRPLTVVATVVLAALLVLGVVTDPVLLGTTLGITALLLAWGWPRLLGSSSRFGSTFAIGATGVLTFAATASTGEQPYLRLVPVTLAIGLGLMFGHQILRRDGRPRLTESVGVTAYGLALVALGSAWMPLARNWRATDLAVVALVALAVSSLADLAVVHEKVRAWMLPLAMVLGGATGILTASVIEATLGSGSAALVGLLVAGVAHSVRRSLTVLPGIGFVPSQLAAAAAGLLAPGVVAYGVSLVVVG